MSILQNFSTNSFAIIETLTLVVTFSCYGAHGKGQRLTGAWGDEGVSGELHARLKGTPHATTKRRSLLQDK
jgi:hypothetical protein